MSKKIKKKFYSRILTTIICIFFGKLSIYLENLAFILETHTTTKSNEIEQMQYQHPIDFSPSINMCPK